MTSSVSKVDETMPRKPGMPDTGVKLITSNGPPTLARTLRYIIQFSAVGTIYFFLVRFSLELASAYPAATAMWPPAGFALFAAAYAANDTSFDLSYAAVATAAGSAFEALAGAVLVNWWAGGRDAFLVPTGVFKFVLIAIIAAAIKAMVISPRNV